MTTIIMPQGRGSYTLEFYSDTGVWLFCLNQDSAMSFEQNLDALLKDGYKVPGADLDYVRSKCVLANRQLFPHLYAK